MSMPTVQRGGTITSAIVLAALLVAVPGGATEPCRPSGDKRQRFASAALTRSAGHGTDFIGNAFVISARPGKVCDAANPDPACHGLDQTRRPWRTIVVTAAHVVRAMCVGSAAWQTSAPGKWIPGRLSLYPNSALDNAKPVTVDIDEQWCRSRTDALSQIPGPGDDLPSLVRQPNYGSRPPPRSDIHIFRQTFILPRRSVMIPFTPELLPRQIGDKARVIVRGFLPTGDSNRSMPVGDGQVAWFEDADAGYSAADSTRPAYKLNKFVAGKGRSGSPVGWTDESGRFSVFGIVTNSGAKDIPCETVAATSPAAAADGIATEAADQAPCIPKRSTSSAADRLATVSEDESTYFVPLFRFPALFQSNVRAEQLEDEAANASQPTLDAIIQLYAEMRGRTRPDDPADRDYREAFADLLAGLGPVDRVALLTRLAPLGQYQPGDAMCEHLEPDGFFKTTGGS